LPVATILLFATACTGDGQDTATDPTDTGDTADTGAEPTPVWDVALLGTASTLTGVHASGGDVYAVGTVGAVYAGDDDGDWTSIGSDVDVGGQDLQGIWGKGSGDDLELVAVGTAGTIARLSSGRWSVEDVGTSNHEGVGGTGPGEVIVVGWGGSWHYDGSDWSFEEPPGNVRLNDVYVDGSEAVAVGEDGAVVRRSGDGTWTAVTVDTTVSLHGVSGTSMDDVWGVGNDGVVIHYDGSDWTTTTIGTSQALWAVYAAESDKVCVVGSGGVARRWDGENWNDLPTGVSNNLYAVHGEDGDDLWAVGNRGAVLHYKE